MIRRCLALFVCAAAMVSPQAAQAQSARFIVTVRHTRPALHSLRVLADGTTIHSDAYGVYRTRGQRTETLLANPVEEARCIARMFGICFYWSPAVYRVKPMAADSNGAIYIADPEQRLLQQYDEAAGKFFAIAAIGAAPTALAADSRGNLYFNDPEGCRILRLSQGAITAVAGTGTCGYANDGGPATSAELLSATAMALDAEGRLYFADGKAGVVRRVDGDGIIMTVAGMSTPLTGLSGLAIDGEGILYVSEAAENRVRAIGPDGVARTIAGTGVAGHDGDYGLANAATLWSPSCLAVTASGAIQVCDSDRIRKLIAPAPGRWVVPVLNAHGGLPRTSPGAWLTLLGEFPGLRTMDWSGAIGADGSLPASLGGVSADIAGKACAVAYVSPDRIDLLLPAGLAASGTETLRLTTDGTVAAFPVTVVTSKPGLLLGAGNGKLYAAALTADLLWVTPERPVRGGETVTLYVTGLNIPAPLAPPYDVMQPGGMQVVLRSLGYPVLRARPFSPGVAELTVQIPAGLPKGDAPVRLVYEGQLSTEPAWIPLAAP
ncbi:MAG: hypothetical protein JNK48_05495 [Bryobacterales bacterium]|nr:hypothetical protein [Bryobacterales bacterium]